MNRLNLYMVDMKYIRNLHQADDRVSSVSPQIGKATRVYIGILIIVDSHKYIVPLSHPQDKHLKMRTSADFDKIYDKDGHLIAVLNFNLMIPIEEKQLIPLDLNIYNDDSPKTKAYKHLCIIEISYCRHPNFSKIIRDKAANLYDLCTSPNSNYKGKSRCLDFKKLEEVCRRYNSQ